MSNSNMRSTAMQFMCKRLGCDYAMPFPQNELTKEQKNICVACTVCGKTGLYINTGANEKMFIAYSDKEFRIVEVLDDWQLNDNVVDCDKEWQEFQIMKV